jgi:iron complex outermembrane receptor protein
MLKRTRLAKSLLIAFSGTALCSTVVHAQDAGSSTQELQRVEITGSAIKRIDAETAVPVTVIKMDDLKKSGVTTIEQVMANLSAVQVQVGTNFSVGCSNCGGAAFADLRGIGQNKTLVLLNGRRIANNAIDGSAPDLNVIPFAAIERVEVLRDGASALYGTDAIGGVINFITRKDFTGGTVTLGYDSPQHPGGKSYSANVGYGVGDLERDGFNVFGFFDYQKQDNISGSQRPFNARFPGGLSGSTSPANYYQDGSVVGNPSAPSCAGPSTTFLIPAGDNTSCKMTTSNFVDYVPKSERYSGMLKGTLKLNESAQLGLEYFFTQSTVETLIAPVPYGGLIQNPTMPNGQPNPYYPGHSGNSFTPAFTPSPTFNPTDGSSAVGSTVANPTTPFPNPVLIEPGYMNVKWRDLPNGPRGDKNVNTQQRFVASLEGNIAGWDYQTAATWNESKVDQNLISGYNNGDIISEGVLEGVINPYGPQSAAGSALIASAQLSGLLVESKGTVYGVDGHASREVGDWLGAGRPAALAIGAEYRHEDFKSASNTSFAELVVASTGTDPTAVDHGTRNVYALYTELNVPIIKTLDVTAALRYDHYSDAGSTTNPKVSFRFQPLQELLVRGSYGTGFRAPSLYELNASQTYGTGSELDNPITCPNGKPAKGYTSVNNCGTQFEELSGGNLTLKPEKSKNWSFGIVVEPIADASLGLDFWWVRLTQTIGSITDSTLAGDYATFKNYFHFAANNQLSTDGTQCPGSNCGYIDIRTQNLGGTNTNGVDLSATYKLRTGSYGTFGFNLNSTYVIKYEYQDFADGPWNQNVGIFSGTGPIFRWQHNVNLSWLLGPYSAGLAGHYKSGYIDQDPSNNVASYTTFDLFGSWAPTKALTLTLGVKNLFDRDPPYTNQTNNFQGGGWDSRYTDPTGRTYYARGTYTF